MVVVGCAASREDVPPAIGRCFTHAIQVWMDYVWVFPMPHLQQEHDIIPGDISHTLTPHLIHRIFTTYVHTSQVDAPGRDEQLTLLRGALGAAADSVDQVWMGLVEA